MHPVQKPDKYSDAESSSSPASSPVVSNIAGYNLAQYKIINVWDVQRSEQAIKAEKKREKQLAIKAALASRSHCSFSNSLVC